MIDVVDGSRVECVVEAADQLGETPLWCERTGRLWWVDIERPRLQSLDPATGAREIHPFDVTFLGCHALTRGGAQLLAVDLALHLRDPASGALDLFTTVEPGAGNRPDDGGPDASGAVNRLNDGRVDARGRLWIGSMDNGLRRPTGSLYRVDPDGSVHRILGDVIVSNGITFSPDDRTLYFTDTRRYRTWRFDLDIDDGRATNRQVFADYADTRDRPDGACVDVDGCIWTAFFGGGRVARYRPNGVIDRVVPMPVTNPTCVCFGGRDYTTLYVTSATKFLTPEQRASEPLAGHLFAIEGIGQGLPEHRFGL